MQVTLGADQSGTGYKRARATAAPAHLRALMAAKPRIQAMIQDAVTPGILPKHPLQTRLAAVIETATSTYLEALDDDDRATAKLYVQKAAQAADEAKHVPSKRSLIRPCGLGRSSEKSSSAIVENIDEHDGRSQEVGALLAWQAIIGFEMSSSGCRQRSPCLSRQQIVQHATQQRVWFRANISWSQRERMRVLRFGTKSSVRARISSSRA